MKGFTAIEIVFMIFILVVVVLVVIQLVTKYVNPSKLNPYIEDVEKNYKYLSIREQCNRICNDFKTASNEGERLLAAVRWCGEKLKDKDKPGIDMIEDGIYNGFYVIAGFPYCEDGTYCFHFFTCDAGITLDIKECRRILCEYYYRQLGDYSQATEAVKKQIEVGTCKVDRTRVPEGKKLLKENANWWYEMYYSQLDCEAEVTGTGSPISGETGGGGGPPKPPGG